MLVDKNGIKRASRENYTLVTKTRAIVRDLRPVIPGGQNSCVSVFKQVFKLLFLKNVNTYSINFEQKKVQNFSPVILHSTSSLNLHHLTFTWLTKMTGYISRLFNSFEYHQNNLRGQLNNESISYSEKFIDKKVA